MTAIKIKKITKLKQKEDVYDILDVEDNHNFLANGMVVHNCDIFGRGIGACYVKDKNPSQDAWRIKDFSKVGSYNEFTFNSKVVKTLKKHPNFWQIVKFPKPPKNVYDKYLLVREKNVYDDDNVFDTVTGEDINNALLILSLRDIMMQDGSLSMNRIVLHIKNEYDINIGKKDVKVAVDDAKQLVTKVREQVIKG